MTQANGEPEAWKNRIIGEGEAQADSFLANPDNWRIHPLPQQQGMDAVLGEVGWVARVMVNKRSSPLWGDKQGVETLVDGHLRVTRALHKGDKTPVPFTYVDLTPEEEAIVIQTLDPLAAMAATDQDKLAGLRRSVQSDNQGVQLLLSRIMEKEGIDEAKTLADLERQRGTPSGDDFWPAINIKVPPPTFDLYKRLMKDAAGKSDAERFDYLLHSSKLV